MNAKKEAPRTAATGKGANTVHTTEHDSGNWPDGQEVYCRITLGLWYEIRKKYSEDWKRLYNKRDKEGSFFDILAVAYEIGRENGIRQERKRRRERAI